MATDPEVRVRFPALPDFLRSSGSYKFLPDIFRIRESGFHIFEFNNNYFFFWATMIALRVTTNFEDQVSVIMSSSYWATEFLSSGTGFPFRRLLQLAWLGWRYSNPPLRGNLQISDLHFPDHRNRFGYLQTNSCTFTNRIKLRLCSGWGFPSNATLVWIFYLVTATCFGLISIFRWKLVAVTK
jgi:hypothetical protein